MAALRDPRRTGRLARFAGAREMIAAIALLLLATVGSVARAQGRGGDAPAAAAESPEAVIRSAIADAFAVLRDEAMAGADHRAARIRALRRIADRAFDWDDMAKRSLGVRWRSLSPADRRAFVDVFQGLLAQEYIDDIDQMRGDEQVDFGPVEHGAGTAVVHTLVHSHSGERVPMSYYMREDAGRYRVYDVSVEGVSLVRHYRETLGRFLVNHTFEELMRRLRQRAAGA